MARAAIARETWSELYEAEREALPPRIPPQRQASAAGSVSRRTQGSCHLVATPANRGEATARDRRISRITEEIANGRYGITSSELAERLVEIARHESEWRLQTSSSSSAHPSRQACDL